MVDFAQLQRVVKAQLEQDRTIRAVEVSGATLELAVSEAATLLDIPVRRLEYEIAERGFPGIFGTGKKEWKINAYARTLAQKKNSETVSADTEQIAAVPVIENKDGAVFVQLRAEGALLKVIAPLGNGRRAVDEEAMHALAGRGVANVDAAQISKIVREASGAYVKVGAINRQAANDSVVSVVVSADEMKAHITVTPPGPGGCDISAENYISYLQNHRIQYGIREDFLRDFADRPVYREQILAAEGLKAVDGRDAYIQYNFETDTTKAKLREGDNGKVDFKELNIIRNVVENQPLAKKIAPEVGIMGKTVTGKSLPAKSGKDIGLPLGKNVHTADDGETILADINGQVVIVAEKINVEPVYEVQGNVNLKTGNIIFLGTVIIKGNVEVGFSVKAAGNIEVSGTVERAELDAEGDIIVHQGITGKGNGIIRAGKSIWAKFIENSAVEAGNMVVVSDGIINAQVDAGKRIVCDGKRARVVGGRLRATEEINVKALGSPTGSSETICEVGYDPKSKDELVRFTRGKEAAAAELTEVQRNLQTLINIKKQRGSLPEDKEVSLQELMERRQTLMEDVKKADEGVKRIQETFENIDVRGRVSASDKVYPGVRIIIRDARDDVRNEYKAVTFVQEEGLIRVVKYEETNKEDIKRGSGGRSAN
ncbi:polymerase [Spirochaetia bacterium]|nr:polymerase [Spirochaetia bacterium]